MNWFLMQVKRPIVRLAINIKTDETAFMFFPFLLAIVLLLKLYFF